MVRCLFCFSLPNLCDIGAEFDVKNDVQIEVKRKNGVSMYLQWIAVVFISEVSMTERKRRKTEKRRDGIPDLEGYLEGRRRHLVNYFEGTRSLQDPILLVCATGEAGANYRIRKTAVVDVGIIEEYLAGHPDVAARIYLLREV